MAAAWMPTNQVSRSKAEEIAESSWDKRKAGLLAQYHMGGKKNGIALALRWVKSQSEPGFQPTRRQLDLRLKRWLDNRDREAADRSNSESPTESTLLPMSNSFGDQRTLSVRSLTPTPASASTHAMQSTLAESTANLPTQHLERSSDAVGSGLDLETARPSSSKRLQHDAPLREVKTRLEVSKEITIDRSFPSQSSYLQPAGISKTQLQGVLKKINIHCNSEQLRELAEGRCPRPSFSSKQRSKIEDAANFLGTSHPGADAFILHFILLAFVADDPAPSEQRLRLLKTCVLTADNFQDAAFVYQLVVHETALMRELDHTDVECFLLQVTQAFVLEKLKRLREPRNLMPKIGQESLDAGYIVATLRQAVDSVSESIQRDLHNYHIIKSVCRQRNFAPQSIEIDGLSQRACSSNLRLLRTELLRRWFIAPDHMTLTAEIVYLKECLEWCCGVLNPWSWFNKVPWQVTLAQEHLDFDVSATLGVYWLMWTHWQEPGGHEQQKRNNPWTASQTRNFGISTPELLWELVELALASAPKEAKRPRSSRIFGKDYWECLRRASDGFQHLSTLPGAELAERFLDRILNCQHQVSRPSSTRQRILSFKVFGLAMETQPRCSDDTFELNRHPAFTLTSCNPALRSSDTGSDLSSMRRHKRMRARFSASTGTSDNSFKHLTDTLFNMWDGQSLFDISEALPEVAPR